MKLQTYHFLKYGKNISPEYYFKNYSESTFLCFDLEDSIQSLGNDAETTLRKAQSRETLEFIVRSNIQNLRNLNIGIRLNQLSSAEFVKDIALLFTLHGSLNKLTLFLPKTESLADIQTLLHALDESVMAFVDIVAIIENKTGMSNLSSILSKRSSNFNKIAFGHCDYNADSNNFPFYHQDSTLYWEVVENLLTSVEAAGFTYINSPCLHLDDKELFDAMLRRLTGKSVSGSVGQIVLTHKQANWCRGFSVSPHNEVPTDTDFNRHSGSSKDYAKRLIAGYEANRNGKSFSIAGDKRVLISPHEYLAAKRHLGDE